jgi:multidrug efflux pump subunit AcrA (membrane-fusion protein)
MKLAWIVCGMGWCWIPVMLVSVAEAQSPAADVAASPAWATQGRVAPVNHVGEGHVDLEFCRVQLISEVEVPAQESGPLVAMPVIEGQAVGQFEELALIDDSLARLQLETARTKLDAVTQKANNDIDVRAASNALEIAEKERKRNYQLYSKGSMPKAEYDRSALQAKQAALQLEQARRDMQAAARDAQVESYNVKAATRSIERHRIKSPIAGMVMEVFKQPGEWVNAGDNVVRVAAMDRLYVQGLLDSGLFNPHEVERRLVTISVPVARGEFLEFEGQIVFVGLEKYNSRSYVVRAEVQNRQHDGRWLLMANEDEATMRIHLGDDGVRRLSSR